MFIAETVEKNLNLFVSVTDNKNKVIQTSNLFTSLN